MGFWHIESFYSQSKLKFQWAAKQGTTNENGKKPEILETI